jgi:hypothetical protein
MVGISVRRYGSHSIAYKTTQNNGDTESDWTYTKYITLKLHMRLWRGSVLNSILTRGGGNNQRGTDNATWGITPQEI